ncbi:2-hydroxyglutaryl-CoA dehydratase D-component [Maritimibacter alkaliphilus HTCC2654]|uniref:2-hydroxyglutaryl-CoA dehydratase, subunit alpha (HgdA) n=1 Tax=Maritimibacter alkaliphilus HTCC2654 TaxID=314271 RepID=A3VG14_9RHOB|nr:2-hydroxyacyl-CoA dehydratase family protein [Maritimibacter alkaliphilus]EAQ12790.1 2-hydroxyglutaryl-CoA dehydratase, subunit alpha (hgdA) [Rhodobacterales bacterium HTCC2654] [Maritimibacter alkaliphilus HTCC2654]TYP85816.1 2-hydroxyglutaryl-CoA dehydratase D-component [Maritimibacter alkaliphilus HTCC2654]
MAYEPLAISAEAMGYQRDWTRSLRSRIENGAKFAFVNADTPHEIFHAMDMPMVVNQWWSSVIAAKQLSTYTLDRGAAMGFHDSLAKYSAMGVISALDGDPDKQPWGGLPDPAILCARQSSDDQQRLFQMYADKAGTRLALLHSPAAAENLNDWWVRARDDWEALYGTARLDLMQAQITDLIADVEEITGRRFDHEGFGAYMEQIEKQELIFEEASRMIAAAERMPVRIGEQIPNVMIPQWHRGSDWAVGHAERFRDAVGERIAAGRAVVDDERVRMMWIGAGLWFDTKFYTAFEEEFGAVFAWSMYLPFAADGYVRRSKGDYLRALAARVVTMNEQLHQAPWANAWLVKQARDYRIDLAVVLVPEADRPSGYATNFITEDLREAGVEVVEIHADMVDARKWNGARAKADVIDGIRRVRGAT